jgi:hypothetical protein
MKSTRMTWFGNVECMGEITKLLSEKLEGGHLLGELGIDERVILKQIKRWDMRV